MSTGLYSGTSGLALGVGLYAGNPGLWGGGAGFDAGLQASLYLNFLAGAPLDSRVTFTRGSNATLVDSTGKITYAPANLFQQSQTFEDAYWIKAGATVTANATTAPDGTATADNLVENTSSGGHYASGLSSVTAGTTYTMSVYVKAAGRSWVRVVFGAGFATTNTWFDIANGTVGTVGATSASIQNAGNGWYRVTATQSATSSTSGQFFIASETSGSGTSYTGDGTSGIFIWGAQLEPVTYQTTPSTYVATTSAAYYGPRFDYDPVTLAAKGLLIEEQRTNLLLQSQTFDNASWAKVGTTTVTPNTAVAPDGTTTADRVIIPAGSNQGIQQSVTVSTGSYRISVWARAVGTATTLRLASFLVDGSKVNTFSLPVGNFVRYEATFTYAVGGAALIRIDTNDVGGTIEVWGAQLEQTAFVTSYIPTVASQVTRSADVATMTGTNFSSWYNQSEGTFVADFDVLSAAAAYNKPVITSNDGTLNNRILLAVSVSSQPSLTVTTGGVFQGTLANSAVTNNTVVKTALAYKVSDFAVASNGATPVTQATGNVPTALTRFEIGAQVAGATYLNGHIRQIAYYNTRLPNAQLQALTA